MNPSYILNQWQEPKHLMNPKNLRRTVTFVDPETKDIAEYEYSNQILTSLYQRR